MGHTLHESTVELSAVILLIAPSLIEERAASGRSAPSRVASRVPQHGLQSSKRTDRRTIIRCSSSALRSAEPSASAHSLAPFSARLRIAMSRSPRKNALLSSTHTAAAAAAEQQTAAGVSTAATPVDAAMGHKSPRKPTQPRAPANAGATSTAAAPATAASSPQSADPSVQCPASRPTHHAVWSFAAKAPISQQLLPSTVATRAGQAAVATGGGSEEKQEDEVAPEQLASQPSTIDPSADEGAGTTPAAPSDDAEPAELRSWHDEIPEETFDQLTVEAEARALLNQPIATIDDPTEYEDTFDAPPPEDEQQLQNPSRKGKRKSRSVDASSASGSTSARSPPAKPKQKPQPRPPPPATASASSGASTPVRQTRTPLSARQSSSSSSSKLKAAATSAAESTPPRSQRPVQPLPSIAAALDSAAAASVTAAPATPLADRAEDGPALLPSTSILHPALPVVAIKPPSTAGSASSFSVISQLHSTLSPAQRATQNSQNALSAKNLRIRSLQRENEALGGELDKCKQQLQAERDKRQLHRISSVSSIASSSIGGSNGGGGAGSLGSTLTVQAQLHQNQNRKHHRHAKRSRALQEDLAASKIEVNKLSVALDTARRRLRIKLGREAPPALLRALRQARAEASELKLQLSNSLASQASFEQLMDLQHTVDEQSALIDQLHSQLRAVGARIDEDEVEVQMLPATSQLIRAQVVEGSVALSSPPRSAAPKDPLADDDDDQELDPPASAQPSRQMQQQQQQLQPRVAEQKAAWGAQQGAAAAGTNQLPSQPKSLSPSSTAPASAVAAAAAPSSSPLAASPAVAPATPAKPTDTPVDPALAATVAALRNDLVIQRALVSQYSSRQLVHDRLSKQQYLQLVSLTREYNSRGEIIHQLNARIRELQEDREWQAQERAHGVEPISAAVGTPMTPQSPSSMDSPISQASKAAIMPPPIALPLSPTASSTLMHPAVRRIVEAASPDPAVAISSAQPRSQQSTFTLPTQGSMYASSSAAPVSPSQPHSHPLPQPQHSSPSPPRAAIPALQLPTIGQTMAQQVTSAPSTSSSVASASASASLSPQRTAPSFAAALSGTAMMSSNSPRSPPPAFTVTPALAALTSVLIQQRPQQIQQPQHGYGHRAWPQAASPLSSPLPVSKVTRSRQHMAAALSAYSGSQSHR